ncbi:hypothetical protein [Ammoniphilus sp. YIM 78166]|uniref:hypothetical protein n=1 Tax=Ammoniphilus sp. YIM 78166 TaxID=1644106 RepID=UPI001070466C|nr:hypothetical protein [Ammoniphilus sp. YIM 78166]
MRKFRALSCLVFALCLIFYAVPRLPVQGISQLATGFSLVWIAFAFLVIGSNLYFVMGTERQKTKRRDMPVYSSPRLRGGTTGTKKRRISIDI